MMKDLLGIGKGAEKLLDVVSRAIGVLYRPYSIRREADAEAYSLRVLEKAKAEAESERTMLMAKANIESQIFVTEVETTLKERAKARREYEELIKQKNLESVVLHGLLNCPEDVSDNPLDSDWLRQFFKHAEEVSSDQMQQLWGKILAGEVEKPGTYSVRALDTLKKITQTEAIAFQRACSLSSQFPNGGNIFIINGYVQNPTSVFSTLITLAHNTDMQEILLHEFGLPLTEIMSLQRADILHRDTLFYGEYGKDSQINIVNNGIDIKITFIPRFKKIQIRTYIFTQVGKELSQLIPPSPNKNYLRNLKSSFSKVAKCDLSDDLS